MNNKTTIAGLSITVNFCKKVNKEAIKSIFIAQEPLANIYNTQKEDIYTVNIIAHIPTELKDLHDLNEASGLYLDKDKKIFLNYNGVCNINTPIHKSNDSGNLLCRDFGIEYNCVNPVVENYNLYHIQFDYKLSQKNFQSVEAIIVKLINEDPETDRGTVTTVRTENN